jgi:hypothetical protein
VPVELSGGDLIQEQPLGLIRARRRGGRVFWRREQAGGLSVLRASAGAFAHARKDRARPGPNRISRVLGRAARAGRR